MHHFRLLIYFLSYTWSLKCGQLQDWKTWVGVYVKCYCFSIFVVVDSVYYKYQYRITYTLCCGLNRLQVYVTEIKEKQIFERIRWQTWALFESVFYKFAAPCGWLSARSCGHFGSQQVSYRRNRRESAICKKSFQKCGVSSLFFYKYFFVSSFWLIQRNIIQITTQCVCYTILVNNFCVY